MERACAGWPWLITNGGWSAKSSEHMAVMPWAPMRTNWCTTVKPPRITQSPTSTWPASCELLAKIVLLPTTQSCARCTYAISQLSLPTRVTPPPPGEPML